MIESVRLKDFKNFRDATLHLGPLTVIVGTNASGKSNIRDAFRFLHGVGRGYSLAEIIGEKYVEGGALAWSGIRGSVREVARSGTHGFKVETVFRPRSDKSLPTRLHSINVVVGYFQPPLVEQEFLESEAKHVYCAPAASAASKVQSEHLLPVDFAPEWTLGDGDSSLTFLAGQPVISQIVGHIRASHEAGVNANEYLDQLASMRFLDLSPSAMKVPSTPGQVVLGDRGENLSSVLQAICEDDNANRAMKDWIRELTPLDVVDFEFVPDQVGRVLVTLVEANGQRTSAYSASDGTLRFLALMAALFGPDAAKFYFLEEIDNGIHPTRLHLLLQLIEQQASEGKVQIVTTTHSPQLLAILSDEAREHASVVYRNEGESEGHIRRIMDIPDIRSVLEEQNIARLHESGWFENAVAFAETTKADG